MLLVVVAMVEELRPVHQEAQVGQVQEQVLKILLAQEVQELPIVVVAVAAAQAVVMVVQVC